MEQQEIVFRLSMMEQQMQQLQQQLQAVEDGINELESLDKGLDEIHGSTGKEILAQIGKGIYVKAKIASEELTVNVGENSFVNRDIKGTKKLIEGQISKLKDVEAELKGSFEVTNREFMRMIQDYQEQDSNSETKIQ